MRSMMRILLVFGTVLTLGIVPAMAQEALLPINYGQTVTGELNDIQQALKYVFDAEAGDSIIITMQTTSGDLDASLRLSTFEGDELVADDNSAGGTDALIQFDVTANGSYVIAAQRSRIGGGAGSFSLTLNSGNALPEQAPAVAVEVGPRIQPILRGTPIQGALSPQERFSLYWFEGRSEETISITQDSGTNLEPLLVLYDEGFAELGRSTPGIPLAVTLPSNGVYFLAVSLPANINTGGNYALTLSSSAAVVANAIREVEPGQNAIAYGDSVRGTINTVNNAYTFQFRAAAGDVVSINMSRAGGDLDSYVYLLDSGGVTLAENDNGGASNGDSTLTLSIPQDGDYLILATRTGGETGATAGNFLLTLQSDSTPIPIAPAASGTVSTELPANLAQFPQISIGETAAGTLNDQLFLLAYVFRADAAEELTISMNNTSGDLDPLLLLLDEQQVPIAENDDVAEGNQNSQLVFTVPTTGWYVVVATRFERETGLTSGEYELSILREGQTVGDPNSVLIGQVNAEPILPNSTPSGSFSPQQFANIYSFGVVEDNSVIDISVTTDNNIPTTVLLTDDRLQPLAVSDAGSLLGVTLPTSGNYLFFVAPANGPAGTFAENYLIAFTAPETAFAPSTPADPDDPDATEVDATPVPIEDIPIQYDETVNGTVTDEQPEQRYIFTGTADDTIRIAMSAATGSGLDTLIQLLDPSGVVIEENDDIIAGENRNSVLQTILPADGTYTIRATRYTPSDGTPATIGDYVLDLQQVDPAAVGVSPTILPILNGQTITNVVNDEQFLMFYQFEANGGQVATIEVDTAAFEGDLDAVLYLYTYSSAGQPIEIARNDDSPLGGTFDPLIQEFSIPRTGIYLIAVGRSPEGGSNGEFAMTLTVANPSSDSGDDN